MVGMAFLNRRSDMRDRRVDPCFGDNERRRKPNHRLMGILGEDAMGKQTLSDRAGGGELRPDLHTDEQTRAAHLP
jgi:hypothetical protein